MFAFLFAIPHDRIGIIDRWGDSMAPLFGKQAAKLFFEEEYKELERQRQLLKEQEERMLRDVSTKREISMAEVQAKIEWFDAHKQYERGVIEREKENALYDIELKRSALQESLDLIAQIDVHIENERKITKAIADEAMQSTPYVATMLADCKQAYDMLIAKLLESKSRPALKAADTVREYSKAQRALVEENRLYKHRLSILDEVFPWLNDLFDMSTSELAREASVSDDPLDPVKHYVTSLEYYSMSEDERNQLALDRYIESHKKSKWQIGRDYEMYISHLFRQDGYTVECPGVLYRYDDCGRDVIIKKNGHATVIQCKYWSVDKTIHEKHIFQLFGTSMCYQIEHSDVKVSCVLVTNTRCSIRAKSFAKKMGVIVKEHIGIGDFPRIKCNISDTGERIYHLPMDQQYDNVVIDKPGEFFAMSVQEAVDRGFRRAYRWHGT